MRISNVGMTYVHAVPFTSKNKRADKADKQAANSTNITQIQNTGSFYPRYRDVDEVMKSMQSNDCSPDVLQTVEGFSKGKKKYFIEQFCIHTGFPNLDKVNNKIKGKTKETIETSAQSAGLKVLAANYNSHSSINFNLGLPGSDMDALGIIVDEADRDKINQFKGNLWNNMDPSIISIRQEFEFPDVYSLDEIENWTGLLDKLIEKEGLNEKGAKYERNLKVTDDFKEALEFNIDIAAMLKKYTKEELIELSDNKELTRDAIENDGKTPINITQSMSSLLESIRSGTPLIEGDLSEEQSEKLEKIKNSSLYKYGNMCIQTADFPLKNKLKLRQEQVNAENFDKLNQEQKLDLILRMYYESYPQYQKEKVSKTYGEEFNALFDNGEGVDENRLEAFNACADS